MQPARCRWSCRGTRRPRKLRSCLGRVAIDPHRSRASIRLLPCAPHLPPPASSLFAPAGRAPQENGKIEADTGPRQTTTFSRKRPGSRIRSDRFLPCKTGWWSFLWNSANRTCLYTRSRMNRFSLSILFCPKFSSEEIWIGSWKSMEEFIYFRWSIIPIGS